MLKRFKNIVFSSAGICSQCGSSNTYGGREAVCKDCGHEWWVW